MNLLWIIVYLDLYPQWTKCYDSDLQLFEIGKPLCMPFWSQNTVYTFYKSFTFFLNLFSEKCIMTTLCKIDSMPYFLSRHQSQHLTLFIVIWLIYMYFCLNLSPHYRCFMAPRRFFKDLCPLSPNDIINIATDQGNTEENLFMLLILFQHKF